MSAKALKYLLEQQTANKELSETWTKLEELYNKKLWHQTTLLLLEVIKHPSLQKNDELLKLYHNFVSDFENKMNHISLVEICGAAVKQLEDSAAAIAFIEKIEVKVKATPEAVVLCKVVLGNIRLYSGKDTAATKKLIEDVEPMVDDLPRVSFIHGRFYLLASGYYKQAGMHAQYFRTALRFLGCTEPEELKEAEKQEYAFYLALAALLGEGIYNFGELLAHPVLESLRTTPHAWLVDLLLAFNSGDLSTFERLRPQWEQQADLKAKQLELRQKISLLALMEMTFKRPALSRCVTFAEVAAETRLPEDEVELLVMKALAQKLVRGHIDQVDRTVNLVWVQPRVLDKNQLSSMIQRLDVWCRDVQSMEMLLENKAHDILTY
ncbi:26S proteasome non-ATPase regulatory subunit 13-like [Pollicipes pollicipes]|uniref:26S proteasome non-ATPase regulatory subunit 13-like n=1 Tax=Pollicipes pollicipes TaxID=41117 RepID=UPI001884D49C|nr:26S proteasome non-ATPase regulatory subunit 13-like [Pollicipes pollicipes]XP_037087109.1 26S proteasome non-ATPase regulatory subunit 13-like [Pollicipes pollicipes]